MNIILKFIGNSIIEMVCSNANTSISEQITQLNGKVNEAFIENLENLVEELKNHNQELN